MDVEARQLGGLDGQDAVASEGLGMGGARRKENLLSASRCDGLLG